MNTQPDLKKKLKEVSKIRDSWCREYTKMRDAAEMLWVVLANVSGGDWTKQNKAWQKAAARWRNNYLKIANKRAE